MRILDKQWFLSHCEWIYNNRHKLQNRTCAEFVISGLTINAFACPYGNYKIDKITLGNLINLWNSGFTYKDLPLLHYHQAYGDNSINISYIDNGKLINHRFEDNDREKYIPNDEVKQILRNLL
ncbi:MAG: hypothetical protein E7020_07080 [Alphaproteobacteria bacterium]|nr:hypothetical protein [Alphaproteobacteria bacterium]